MVISLMLAQAKAKAKLAQQAVEFYSSAVDQARSARQAKAVNHVSEYAEAITQCTAGINVATQNKLPPTLAASVEQLRTIVSRALSVAEKDNNSIYLEAVPRVEELKPIIKAATVPEFLTT